MSSKSNLKQNLKTNGVLLNPHHTVKQIGKSRLLYAYQLYKTNTSHTQQCLININDFFVHYFKSFAITIQTDEQHRQHIYIQSAPKNPARLRSFTEFLISGADYIPKTRLIKENLSKHLKTINSCILIKKFQGKCKQRNIRK